MGWYTKPVLVTGARGSLGMVLCERLRWLGADVYETDIDSMDVCDAAKVEKCISGIGPDVVFHLAGAKHAPEGELDPWGITETNVRGTQNVLQAAAACERPDRVVPGARVVLASSCKACDPETVYGATKLIAERMVLNAGGSVARFYNVRETCGNVFEIWRGMEKPRPLPVTSCQRFFMSAADAVALLLYAADAEPGRYVFARPERWNMDALAHELYPRRWHEMIPPRRGDRLVEPRYAASETHTLIEEDFVKVTSPHDPVRVQVAA